MKKFTQLIKYSASLLLLAALLFHMTTCNLTEPYCPEHRVALDTFSQAGGSLHNQHHKIRGTVTHTYNISFLMIRVYRVADANSAIWVKAPLGEPMPAKGTVLTVCGLARNLIDWNGNFCLTLLVQEGKPPPGQH